MGPNTYFRCGPNSYFFVQVSASAGKERDDHGSGEGEGKQPSEGSLLLKRAKIVKVRGDTPTVNRKRGIKPQGRKRWRPEEIDPMIAAEDEELKVSESPVLLMLQHVFSRSRHGVEQS